MSKLKAMHEVTYFLEVNNHPLWAPNTALISETAEDSPVSGLTLVGGEKKTDGEREPLTGVGQNDKELGEHVEPRDRGVSSVTIPAGAAPHHLQLGWALGWQNPG